MSVNLKSAGGGGVILSPASTGTDVTLTVPAHDGSTIVSTAMLATLTNYADDAAAAVGGIAVGGLYRTGSAIKVRVA